MEDAISVIIGLCQLLHEENKMILKCVVPYHQEKNIEDTIDKAFNDIMNPITGGNNQC